MKTILVTGASGTIGMYVCASLLQKGNKIIATDKQPNEFVGKDNYTFVQSSITDKAKITSIIEGSKIDAMIHLAISVDNDISSMVSDQELEDAKSTDKWIYKTAAGAGIKDILLLSTLQIYAPPKGREPIRETNIDKPATNYAKLKVDSEQALMAGIKKTDCNPVIMRVAPVYTAEYAQNLRARVYDPAKDVGYMYQDGSYGFSLCCLFNLVDFINGIIAGPQGHYDGMYNVCDTKLTLARDILEFEKAHKRITDVEQRQYTSDSIKSQIAATLNFSKRVKADYRYIDPTTITDNVAYDNTKAQRISTFRWKLENTR